MDCARVMRGTSSMANAVTLPAVNFANNSALAAGCNSATIAAPGFSLEASSLGEHKKMAPECPGPMCVDRKLPGKFQSELNVTRSARPDHRIRTRNIRRSQDLAEGITQPQVVADKLLLRILEVRAIQHVEK